MKPHERAIHLTMAVAYLIAAVCIARVANESTNQAALLLWIFNLPIIGTVLHGLKLALGRAASE